MSIKKILFSLLLVISSSSVFALNSYTDSDKYSASMTNLFSSYVLSNCFDNNASTSCISNNGEIIINFDSNVNITNLNINQASSYYGFNLFINNQEVSIAPEFTNVSSIKITPTNSYIYLREISFDFEIITTEETTSPNTFSNFFENEEDAKTVWIALVGLMVAVFGLGYIAKVIRTGGDD